MVAANTCINGAVAQCDNNFATDISVYDSLDCLEKINSNQLFDEVICESLNAQDINSLGNAQALFGINLPNINEEILTIVSSFAGKYVLGFMEIVVCCTITIRRHILW